MILAQAGGRSQILVLAVDNDTVVEITPTKGLSSNVTLTNLEAYQLQSDDDVTGTLLRSSKPVAVFAGGVCLNVPTDIDFCDHLVEQLPPISTWGMEFLTVALANRFAGDIIRIVARDDATNVTIDGVNVAALNATDFYETTLASATVHEISTSRPALLAQFSLGTNADGQVSDPFMMLVPPAEQFLDTYTLTTPAAEPVPFTNFISVVILEDDLPHCTLDGAPMVFLQTTPPASIGSSGFVGAHLSVTVGVHNLRCPSPFGAYAYGYATFDSYGYPAGMALSSIAS